MPDEPSQREVAESHLGQAYAAADRIKSIRSTGAERALAHREVTEWSMLAAVNAVLDLSDKLGMLLAALNVRECASEGCSKITTITDRHCLDCAGIEGPLV
jgi:hypothetical protein